MHTITQQHMLNNLQNHSTFRGIFIIIRNEYDTQEREKMTVN